MGSSEKFCLVLPFLIRFVIINFIRNISKRGWNDDYILYGFAHFSDRGPERAKCYSLQSPWKDSLRPSDGPSKLSNHLLKIHPEYKDKGIAFFERIRVALKCVKLDSSRTYYKEIISIVEASFEVALTVA